MKNCKTGSRIHLFFLMLIFILLLRTFNLMRIWMNWKSLIKHHCLKKKNFIAISWFHVCKKSLFRFWSENITWISWFVFSKWYITLAWCFQNLQKNLLIILSFRFCKVSFNTRGKAWQAVLKKIKVKLEFFTDIDVLLMAEKGIRGEVCHAINQFVKANNRYKRLWQKKNSHILNIGT